MLQSYKLADIMVTVSGPTESAWRIVSAWAVKGFDLLISRNISVVLAHRAYTLCTCCQSVLLTFYAKRDAKKARRGPRRQGNRTTGLVKGEASHRSGRQTEYRKKAGRRNNVDMGDNGLRLDGIRGEMIKPLRSFHSELIKWK